MDCRSKPSQFPAMDCDAAFQSVSASGAHFHLLCVLGVFACAQTVEDGQREFNWTLSNDPWSQNPMRLLTVQVKYSVQGRDYSVQLSTLADGSSSSSTNN